jgi:phosphatidylinositol glycan class O
MSFALSGLTVILNSVGALFLSGLAAPLVALWNRAPLAGAAKNEKEKGEKEEEARGPTPDTQIKGEAVAAALCV